jgi:hypothetical protein
MSTTFFNYNKQQFNADVSLNGATTLSGLNTVSGKTQFNADASFNQALTIAGATTISGATTFTAANTIINGNVGIGKTNPSAQLHLGNNLVNKQIVLYETVNNNNQYFGFGINDGMLRYQIDAAVSKHAFFAGASSSSSNELMRIQGNGNVGIGTSNPRVPLDVSGAFQVFNTSRNNGSGVITYITSNDGSYGSIECFNTGNTGKLPLVLQGYGVGYVGIGMTNPSYSLDVKGGVRFGDSASSIYGINFGQTGVGGYRSAYIYGDGANMEINNQQGGRMMLSTNNSEKVSILANGNVGIGNTSPSWLHTIAANRPNYVCNSTAGNNGLSDFQSLAPFSIWDSGYSTSGIALKMGLFRDTGAAYIQCEAANTGARNILLQPWLGNVGIGTTNPIAPLHVYSSEGLSLATTTAVNRTNQSILGFGFGGGAGVGTRDSFRITSEPVNRDNGNGPTFYDYGAQASLVFSRKTSNGYNADPSHLTYTETMRIHGSTGFVGIGTTNPKFPLHIYGSALISNYNVGQDLHSSVTGSTTDSAGYLQTARFYGGYFEKIIANNGGYSNWGWGICARYSILALEFDAYSDTRIKTNIVDIDDSKALSILRKIQPKTYEYIDKLQRGNDTVIGFIAQEIKEIIPKAVKINKDFVPSFYTICQVSATDVSNIVLVTSPIDLSWNPLHDLSGNAFIDAEGNACSDASGNKVFNVKLYDESNNEIICKTTDVLDKRSFLVDIADTKLSSGEYFLHGQEIDDFHTLDKQAIFTVVTAAVQDIDRQVQSDAAKIAALESDVSSLKSENASLQSQLSALQSQMAAVLLKLNM